MADDIKIGRIVMGSVATNCYFIYRESKKEAVFFDPADDGEMIFQKLTDAGIKIVAICLTHAHFDHIYGLEELAKLTNAPVYALDEEKDLCEDPALNVSEMFGRAVTASPDRYVKDGDIINEADIEFKVIATPGHTKGSCCYYVQEAGMLVSGDTLFEESVGRTDFPTGSASQLVRSINEKLYVLPDETKVYPGHNGFTTIGHEKIYNPFTSM